MKTKKGLTFGGRIMITLIYISLLYGIWSEDYIPKILASIMLMLFLGMFIWRDLSKRK
jgi:hypothetical protein